MKKIFLLITLLFSISLKINAQIDIDAKLPPATEDLVKAFNTYLETANQTSIRIGVLEFEDNSEKTSELGVFLCNEITTWLSLYANGKFTVVSRQDLDKIISEKEASTKYRTNKDKIEVLKKYKLIDYALTATITQFTESYRLNIRILSTSNENAGSVAAVKVINLNRTSDLDKMFTSNLENSNSIHSSEQPNTQNSNQSTINNSTNSMVGKTVEMLVENKLEYNSNDNTYKTIIKHNGEFYDVIGITHSAKIDIGAQTGYDFKTYNVYLIVKVKEGNIAEYQTVRITRK